MREDLKQLYDAGITNCRFSGRLQQWTRGGTVALDQIQSPIGEFEHLWCKEENWYGPKSPPGLIVEFIGKIEPYYKGSGILDFGLIDCVVVRVLGRGRKL